MANDGTPETTDPLIRVVAEALVLFEAMAEAARARGGDPDDIEEAEERGEAPWWTDG